MDTLSVQPHDVVGSLLVATWTQADAGEVSLRWTQTGDHSGDAHSTTPQALSAGEHQRILAGAPYGSTVTVDLLVDDEVASTTTVDTAALPDGVPQPAVLTADDSGWDPDLNYLLLSTSGSGSWGGTWWTVIIDRQAQVVWAQESPDRRVTMQVQTSTDGHDILIDHNSYWGSFDEGAASEVIREKLDGTVVKTLATPGLHHPFAELPDGRLAWGAVDGRDEALTVEQADGSTADLFSCADFLTEQGSSGYCGSNTLRYDAVRDSFLFSFYSVDTVIELDASTGTALRWFGQVPGSYRFAPEDSTFWWQHGVHWTDAGTLLVSTKNQQAGRETWMREYSIDEDSQTLSQIWSFGDGEGIFAAEMGEAWRLGSGNTLQNYGSTARLREVSSDGRVVWDLSWEDGLTIGRMTALSSLDPLLPDSDFR